ncbi:MAG: ParA family protein [Clostridia bacterium]|nr:ParA family protein [Clostridia bacterium]
MGRIIAIYNQKGGVGKTTTTVNLASALAAAGKRVLLVDMDPQGNTTGGVGINKNKVEASVYDLLIGNGTAEEAILPLPFQNLHLLPADQALAGAEIELTAVNRRESRLKAGLASVRENYDYILIDCPPSLGLLSLNALCATDSVIIPIQCEYYALEGLAQLMATMRQVKRLHNPTLDVEGVLLTMFDGRLNLTQQVMAEVKKFFPRKVFATPIPRSVRLAEAPSFGKPINYYDRSSRGCKAYDALAQELIRKH